jgi:hypothetical protein
MTSEEAAMAGSDADEVAMAVVDGNALAGMFASLFGEDMTMVPGRCAHCHTVSMIGQLRAYVRGPGKVLRCPVCDGVVIRIVEIGDAVHVDMTGMSYLRFRKR